MPCAVRNPASPIMPMPARDLDKPECSTWPANAIGTAQGGTSGLRGVVRQSLFNRFDELPGLIWLDQETIGLDLRITEDISSDGAADQEDFLLGPYLAADTRHIQAVHGVHRVIGHEQSGCWVGKLERPQSCFGGAEGLDAVAQRFHNR